MNEVRNNYKKEVDDYTDRILKRYNNIPESSKKYFLDGLQQGMLTVYDTVAYQSVLNIFKIIEEQEKEKQYNRNR